MTEMKRPKAKQDYQLDAVKRLFSEIIRQAVEDYKMAEVKGLVKGGRVMKEEVKKFYKGMRVQRNSAGCEYTLNRIGRNLRYATELNDNLHFLWHDMDALIELVHLNVTANAIRAKLGFEGEP